ncbi:uncharacterized protein [Amphiura filiformis]|uniref:uncharacterized protein n=1 Tax=Amphiura filiformis TaxID=82378 RepID=UPI003B2193D1
MPRRRATKLGSRAKPKLPAGDSGSDMAKERRREKLDALLKDFDMEVQDRICQMEREAKDMCKAIQRATNMEIFKMPQNIKKMTVEEFFNTGGSFNQKALDDYSQQVNTLASSIGNNKPNSEPVADVSQPEIEESGTPPKTTTAPKRGRGRGKKASTTTTTTKTTRTSRRRGASKTASDTEDENTTPAPTRTSTRARQTRRATSRSQYETPASNTGKTGLINAGLNTPMVTPKFDPRLPLTPAVMREAKPSETIISMSGSPISNPSRLDCEKPGLLTLGNGKIIDVEDDTMENLAMDETTRKNIMMLQENLAKILMHSNKNT